MSFKATIKLNNEPQAKVEASDFLTVYVEAMRYMQQYGEEFVFDESNKSITLKIERFVKK